MAFHGRRTAYLLSCMDRLPISSTARVLDVGRSPITNQILARYPDTATLGLPLESTLLDKADPIDEVRVPHFVFDLNQCDDRSAWVIPDQFDVVLFNEVIEHLRLSPGWVFQYLFELLRPGGYLILQTPNAVSFGRRVRMLFGRNPDMEFAMGGETGAHHFREYTKAELIRHAERAGLRVHAHLHVSYFPAKSVILAVVNAIVGVVPSLRNGQTLILQRPR
jgi:trans-aconitate methyltransferase